jgi:hypothetical protein
MQQEQNTATMSGEFPYTPGELAAFSYYFDAFTIQLRDGGTIRYRAADPNAFYEWLIAGGVKVSPAQVRTETRETVAYLLTPPLS